MSVSSIDDNQVNACFNEALGAFKAIDSRGCGGGNAQMAFFVLAGIWVKACFFYILNREQANALILAIDNDKFLNTILVEQFTRLFLGHMLVDRNQALFGHEFAHRLAHVFGKAHIAVGEDANKFAVASVAVFNHGKARDLMPLHKGESVGKAHIRGNSDGVEHYAALEALHLTHMIGLLLWREITVDDPNTARLRHSDSKTRLCYCVHCRGHDWQIKRDFAGNARADVGLVGQYFRAARTHQNIVECQSFWNYA